MKYLIKDKGYNNYMRSDFIGMYCNDPGKGIHDKLPHWLNEDGDFETEVIKSTDPEFKRILKETMSDLQHRVNDYGWKINEAKKSLDKINQTLIELANEQS